MKKIVLLTAIALLLPALVFVFAGCMKVPEINPDFGPESSPQDISQSLSSIQTAGIDTLKQGEFVYFETSSRIEKLYPVVIKQRADTLVTKSEDPNKYTLVIDRNLVQMENGQMKPSHTQAQTCLNKTYTQTVDCATMEAVDPFSKAFKTTALAPPMFATKNVPSDLGVRSGVFTDVSWRKVITHAQSSPKKITYHNFKKDLILISRPSLVLQRTNCGGAPAGQCYESIRAYQISFDEVTWTGSTGEKISYLYLMSPDVPFFAATLMACGSTFVPYMNQKVALLQCDEAKDFTVGHD